MKITPQLMEKLNAFHDKREPSSAWNAVAASVEKKKQTRACNPTGRKAYRVELDPRDLVEMGTIAADQVHDIKAVEAGLQRFLDDAFNERSHPESKKVKGRHKKTAAVKLPESLPLFSDP